MNTSRLESLQAMPHPQLALLCWQAESDRDALLIAMRRISAMSELGYSGIAKVANDAIAAAEGKS